MVNIYINITERKQIETELRAAKEKAEAASRAKSEFLSVASHELRLPLTGILGMAEFLREDNLTLEEQKEYVEHINKAGTHLLSIINDILDFTRLEAGKFELVSGPFDLKVLIEETATMLLAPAKAKGLELLVDYSRNAPSKLIADSRAVRQIIVNLVGNAIKFTHKGHVTINVRCLAQTDKAATLQIIIEDTGIGIPPDKCEAVFNRFEQADSSHMHSYGGTGLGLSITKKLIELMNGKIYIESKVGEGSKFYCTIKFPLQTYVAKEGKAKVAKVKREKIVRTKVLLVEDDRIVQIVHQRMLMQTGCEVVIAEDAKNTLEKCQQGVDVIFMDEGLPDMTGHEVVAEIRRREDNHQRVPIIMLTGFADPEKRELGINAGADEVLVKPVKKEELEQVLQKYVSKKAVLLT